VGRRRDKIARIERGWMFVDVARCRTRQEGKTSPTTRRGGPAKKKKKNGQKSTGKRRGADRTGTGGHEVVGGACSRGIGRKEKI